MNGKYGSFSRKNQPETLAIYLQDLAVMISLVVDGPHWEWIQVMECNLKNEKKKKK